MKQRDNNYSEFMAALGKKGGIARGKKFEKKISQIIWAFITTRLNQQEIAEKLGVSQAMVNKYVNTDYMKLRRLQHNDVEKLFSEDEINIILHKIKLEKELKKEAKISKKKKVVKI